jgi:hypothetical protein
MRNDKRKYILLNPLADTSSIIACTRISTVFWCTSWAKEIVPPAFNSFLNFARLFWIAAGLSFS